MSQSWEAGNAGDGEGVVWTGLQKQGGGGLCRPSPQWSVRDIRPSTMPFIAGSHASPDASWEGILRAPGQKGAARYWVQKAGNSVFPVAMGCQSQAEGLCALISPSAK